MKLTVNDIKNSKINENIEILPSKIIVNINHDFLTSLNIEILNEDNDFEWLFNSLRNKYPMDRISFNYLDFKIVLSRPHVDFNDNNNLMVKEELLNLKQVILFLISFKTQNVNLIPSLVENCMLIDWFLKNDSTTIIEISEIKLIKKILKEHNNILECMEFDFILENFKDDEFDKFFSLYGLQYCYDIYIRDKIFVIGNDLEKFNNFKDFYYGRGKKNDFIKE